MARFIGKDQFIRRRAQLVKNPKDNTYYRDWENATDLVVSNASIQPFQLSENLTFEINKEREYARTSLRVFCTPSVSVEYTDRIIYNGETYDVHGQDVPWTNFKGKKEYNSFLIRIREG